MSELKVAIVSPSNNVISETFIRSHIDGLEGAVFHYYNGHLPKYLAGHGPLLSFNLLARIKRKLSSNKALSPDEQALVVSLRHNQVDVVLAEYGPTGVAMTPICEALGIPLVVHFHGYDASQYDIIEKYREGYKRMFSKAGAVVVVSNKMRQMVQELGANPDSIHILPCGPDPSFMDLVRSPNDIPHFLSVGRFVDKKAPYYVFLAFKELIEAGIKAHLTMVGDGPLYTVVNNLVTYFELGEHVTMTGAIGHQEVKDLMAKADCYVQHSIRPLSGDMEGTPVSIMEAAAAGLQVISTNHAGIPDVILHEETGFLVAEHDVRAMAGYMKRSASSPDERVTMGAASRERIATHFAREINLKQLNDVLRSAHTR